MKCKLLFFFIITFVKSSETDLPDNIILDDYNKQKIKEVSSGFLSKYITTEGLLSIEKFIIDTQTFGHNNFGKHFSTIFGGSILYYGFYHLWRKIKKKVNNSHLGQDIKSWFPLDGWNNYLIPFCGLMLMPRIDVRDSFIFKFKMFNFMLRAV